MNTEKRFSSTLQYISYHVYIFAKIQSTGSHVVLHEMYVMYYSLSSFLTSKVRVQSDKQVIFILNHIVKHSIFSHFLSNSFEGPGTIYWHWYNHHHICNNLVLLTTATFTYRLRNKSSPTSTRSDRNKQQSVFQVSSLLNQVHVIIICIMNTLPSFSILHKHMSYPQSI